MESEQTLPIVPEGIGEEVLTGTLDHEKTLCDLSKNGDHEDSCKENTNEDHEGETLKGLDIPNVLHEEDESNKKRSKLKIDIDDSKANAGFQDLRNIRKFSKAAQMMGTRKGNIYFLMRIFSSGTR